MASTWSCSRSHRVPDAPLRLLAGGARRPGRRLRAARHRPERRRGLRRPPRPRLHRLLRHRRLLRPRTGPARCRSIRPIHLNPFWAIPFAILAAMLAGVLLGAPTLRLRGDYLAIVTLGFGEIIQIVATNLSGVTGGAQGVIGIPHFSIHLFGIHYSWGLDTLPYYYLLLGFVVLVLVALPLARELAGRPRLDGDPRGRGRGGGIGHQRPQVQGDGLRDRRVDVGLRRDADGEQDRLRRSRRLHGAALDPDPRARHLRRHGLAPGRRGRRGRAPVGPVVPARAPRSASSNRTSTSTSVRCSSS